MTPVPQSDLPDLPQSWNSPSGPGPERPEPTAEPIALLGRGGGSVPGPVQSTLSPHSPSCSILSREFHGSRMPCSSKGSLNRAIQSSSQAEHKPSCGQLTLVSIQVHFLNEDQETHGLTPLILSLQGRPWGAKACAVFHVCTAPNSQCPPSSSPRYPELS